MEKVDLDWKFLGDGYIRTDSHNISFLRPYLRLWRFHCPLVVLQILPASQTEFLGDAH